MKPPGFDNNKLFNRYSSVAVFLFFSLSLILPSGYSYGAAMLLLPSIFLLPHTYKSLQNNKTIKIFSLLLAFCFLIAFISYLRGDTLLRDLDGPIRFILIIPVLLFLCSYPPNIKSTYLGIALGASLAGILAIYQKITSDASRVGGHMAVIEFGNIAILYAILSASSLRKEKNSYLTAYNITIFISFLLGLTASILSGTRAGWISVVFLMFALLKMNKNSPSKKTISIAIILLLTFFTVLYQIPNIGFKERTNSAYSDIVEYFDNKKDTSIGLRLEMWRLSFYLASEKPVLGWGEDGYIKRGMEISQIHNIETKALSFDHMHNEALDTMVKHGILGLISLLSLYIFLIRSFSKAINGPNSMAALSGLIFVLCIIDFGLSNVFFNRNSGVMVFCFASAIFLSLTQIKKSY